MKGIVNTIESGVGTVILIVLITVAFGSQLPNQDASSYNSVQRQIERLQATGELEEYVAENNISKLESEIDALPMQKNISIIYENITKSSSSQVSFTSDFNFAETQQEPSLFIWSEGEKVVADLNNVRIYNSSEKFAVLNISSNTQTGTNSLEFSNPSGQRISYAINRRNITGKKAGLAADVSIVRKIVIPEGTENVAEVVIYLW